MPRRCQNFRVVASTNEGAALPAYNDPAKGSGRVGNLLPEIGARFEEEELDRGAGTERRSGKLAGPEETLWCKDRRAGAEERRVGVDPDRLKAAAELERMRAADIGQAFLRFKLRLLVIRDAAGKAAADQRVRDVERRFVASSGRREVKLANAIGEDALRSPARIKEMHVIAEKVLITNRIAAIGGGQTLSRRSGWSVRLAIVAEKIADVEDVAIVEHLRDLPDRLIVVIDLQDRVQYFRLKTELLLDLVDARSAGAHAARAY